MDSREEKKTKTASGVKIQLFIFQVIELDLSFFNNGEEATTLVGGKTKVDRAKMEATLKIHVLTGASLPSSHRVALSVARETQPW